MILLKEINDQVIYPTSYNGKITLPTNLYRLGDVFYCDKGEQNTGYEYLKIQLEEIKKKDINLMLNTIHTRPCSSRPAFVRLTSSTIQVYPHAHIAPEDQYPGSYYWDDKLGPAQYFQLLGNITFTSGSTFATFDDSSDSDRMTKYYEASGHLPQIIDTSGAFVSSGTLIVAPFPSSTLTLKMSTSALSTGTTTCLFAMGNTKCNYIKKPTTPSWTYVEINGAALHNAGNSVDFELHSSEESTLVARILQLAGITLKDNNLLQIGGAEEGKIIQQQKQ